MSDNDIWLRGEGGGIFRMTPPLDPNIQQRWDDGQLLRVNPDGTLWTEPPKRARKPAVKAAESA